MEFELLRVFLVINAFNIGTENPVSTVKKLQTEIELLVKSYSIAL